MSADNGSIVDYENGKWNVYEWSGDDGPRIFQSTHGHYVEAIAAAQELQCEYGFRLTSGAIIEAAKSIPTDDAPAGSQRVRVSFGLPKAVEADGTSSYGVNLVIDLLDDGDGSRRRMLEMNEAVEFGDLHVEHVSSLLRRAGYNVVDASTY